MASVFRDNNISDYFRDNNGMKYDVDIAFVVDATGSMDNVINTVKNMIPQFYKSAKKALDEKNKKVDVMRVKVIFFRDFIAYEKDGFAPLMQTDFYVLSGDGNDESETLLRQIDSIDARGGGDIPEDGLEGLACAMKSDWCKKSEGHKRRHIIALFTDAPTHPIGYGRTCSIYPTGMPKDFEELTELWGNKFNKPGSMDHFAKRLILFIPELRLLGNDDGWKQIANGEHPWENCDVVQLSQEQFVDVDFSRILDRIVNSI